MKRYLLVLLILAPILVHAQISWRPFDMKVRGKSIWDRSDSTSTEVPADRLPLHKRVLPDFNFSIDLDRHFGFAYGFKPDEPIPATDFWPLDTVASDSLNALQKIGRADHRLDARFTPIPFGPRPYALMTVSHRSAEPTEDFSRFSFHNFQQDDPEYGGAFRLDYHFRNGTAVGLGLGSN